MSDSYTNYLATTSFRPYLQPMPGLGTSARTGTAVLLGGPRAGAGSSIRVYNFLNSRGLYSAAVANLINIAQSKGYSYRSNTRNYIFGI